MPTFTDSLERAFHKALMLANERGQEFSTLEHLLLALIEDEDALSVLLACNVNTELLREDLTNYIDIELGNLVLDGDEDAKPTAEFQRVVKRAIIHMQSSAREEVTGANVLVAFFAQRESMATSFLQKQEMTRYDAVNFISHGKTKNKESTENPNISFTDSLERAVHKAFTLANERCQEFSTLEHLLLALIEDEDALSVLLACNVNLELLREDLTGYVDAEPAKPDWPGKEGSTPTPGFQRVLQRAVIHVKSSGREEVTGASVLVAIFAERESSAASFLRNQEMTRYDAVNFISHGVSKSLSESEFQSHDGEQDSPAKLSEKNFQPDDEKKVIEKTTKVNSEKFVFISYAHEDVEFASNFVDVLKNASIPVWWDEDIPTGQNWSREIQEKLKTSTAVVTLWTQKSVSSNSVIEEARFAQSKGKLVPVKIGEDFHLPYGFSETQYTTWNTRGSDEVVALEKILSALSDKLTPPNAEQIISRASKSKGMSASLVAGKISISDTPLNTKPSVENQEDKDARLAAQRALASFLEDQFKPNNCNLPRTVNLTISRYKGVLHWESLSWYALEDAISPLRDYLVEYIDEPWPNSTYIDANNLITRHAELEPLIRPKQHSITELTEFPPIPNSSSFDKRNLSKIATALKESIASQESNKVFDEKHIKTAKNSLEQLNSALNNEAFSEKEERLQYSQVRKTILTLTAIVGTTVAAISAGVATNLLTAPQAAATLFEKWSSIQNMLINLF